MRLEGWLEMEGREGKGERERTRGDEAHTCHGRAERLYR